MVGKENTHEKKGQRYFCPFCEMKKRKNILYVYIYKYKIFVIMETVKRDFPVLKWEICKNRCTTYRIDCNLDMQPCTMHI